MSTHTGTHEQMLALASHLEMRREAILAEWREKAEADSTLATASTLSRVQFNNHIPDVLQGFENRLRLWGKSQSADAAGADAAGADAAGAAQGDEQNAQQDAQKDASEHGLHRWQQGYNLRELTREWGHLQLCLTEELDNYQIANPQASPLVMAEARREMVQLCIEGISESVAQYARLQQAEAAGHARDLEESLVQLGDLERRRAESLREAAHDLRGNLSVVSGATSMLRRDNVPEPMRDEFLGLLQSGVSSLQNMLNDLMDLARLQAGHEKRHIAPFDAAQVLSELCATSQPQAREYELYLRMEGPDELPVEGDAVKVRRIAQNLLLNALKYTVRGGVTIGWREEDAGHWALCVRDTGPGLNLGPAAPLADDLQNATRSAREIEAADKGSDLQSPRFTEPSVTTPPKNTTQHLEEPQTQRQSTATQERQREAREPGEGIGLSIVKRLCELLDAGLELDSQAGRGSTFRVVLPRSYDKTKDAT